MTRSTAARLGAAAVTGALLAAARPPLDLGPLACIAFVPLFMAWREDGTCGVPMTWETFGTYVARLRASPRFRDRALYEIVRSTTLALRTSSRDVAAPA